MNVEENALAHTAPMESPLVAQTCGAPQISGTGMKDADESTSDEGDSL